MTQSTTDTWNKKPFFIVWAGQLISVIGSGLTSFALGVWTFQKTGSATLFAFVTLFAILPGLLITPLAGVAADRLDRRIIMIVSDIGQGVCTFAIAICSLTGHLEMWSMYTILTVSSVFSGFQMPAYQAAVTQLVPKKFFAQASGMIQAAWGAKFIISPILAGFFLGVIKLHGILLLDIVTLCIGVAALLFVKIPKPNKAEATSEKMNLVSDFVYGLNYLRRRKGLIGIFSIIGVSGFMQGMMIVLVGPMVLSFTNEKVLGIMESIAAMGMLLGSVLISVKGGPKQLVPGMLNFLTLAGFGIALMGIRQNIFLITAACFLYFFSVPYITACYETLIRRKVEHDVQGRIFSLVRMILQGATTAAYVVAGPLAENVIEPLIASKSPFAHSLRMVVGGSAGSGIALIFLLSGGFMVLLSTLSFLWPHIRNIEYAFEDV